MESMVLGTTLLELLKETLDVVKKFTRNMSSPIRTRR